MLDEALAVAYRRSQVEQEKVAVATLLDQLPIEVLREIAETGEIKLAFGMCGPDGGANGWLEQFKGTPFFQQAIQLEQEDLQTQTANQQASSVENQKSQQRYAASDQVRLKKKLLELQKAQNEAQVLNSSQGPADMTGSNTAPPPTESPALPAETTGGAQGGTPKLALSTQRITGAVNAASPSRVGKSLARGGVSMMDQNPAAAVTPGRKAWGSAVKDKLQGLDSSSNGGGIGESYKAEVKRLGRDPEAMRGAMTVQNRRGKEASVVDGWAREMARNDMAKVAQAREAFSIADAAGRVMAKTALAAGAGSKILEWAIAHPHAAGAVVGGAVGGLSGAAADGVSGAIKGTVAGAGTGAMLGGAVKGVHSHMATGREFGDAVKAHGEDLVNKVKAPLSDLKKGWAEGAKPPASAE